MTKLDKNPTSTCAKVLETAGTDQEDYGPPSFALRNLLGSLLADSDYRTMIPSIVYRLARCAKKDVDVLSHMLEYVKNGIVLGLKLFGATTYLLDNLIIFSEMWETPTPSVAQMTARFEATTMSGLLSSTQVQAYCAYSKEKSSVCNKFKAGDYDANGIIYEHDEYWNKASKIQDQASVLLMSSELDPMAPSKYATYFLDALDGDKKELITFKYTTQGNLVDSDTMESTCGISIFGLLYTGRRRFRQAEQNVC
ncbi:hypothetical protein PPTG_13756 [Phytophthora nicotianae INRA-310]|uniref:Peptidase S33 tripeptidyl aminopeptidase-like C-terminal domain-containing protein n=1 Tax=Phytophthora nicotianae (strain INRA-310) TaxID=761204 RepID=W2Q0M0_PHYN3|nr:hypothetical protein PPTG_13756 [Phytophthora nicotianae INRA-310]ETN06426.1 hypothetical protein PPTG_13756 [Phytophthora nicotianae INRA-310]